MATTAPEKPAETQPNTPFHKLGGQPVFDAIVGRFYDLMDEDPAFAGLRAMHAPDLTKMRHSLAGFLAAWAGGPRTWFEENPVKCMMSAHKPFAITKAVAGQWAEAMRRAIADVAPADGELAKAMAGVLADMAQGMARD